MDVGVETATMASVMDVHEKIQVFSGNQAVSNYGISVVGSGSWVKGHIEGSMKGYDYKDLYTVYDVNDSSSSGVWIFKYTEDTSHSELKKTFEELRQVELAYNLDFSIQGNDYGVNSVYITYEVIRLIYQGVSKDVVVINNASYGAMLADGDRYPGGFKPIE